MTTEEKRQRNNEAARRWREKNRQKTRDDANARFQEIKKDPAQYEEHRRKKADYTRQWQQDNPGKHVANNQAYRTRAREKHNARAKVEQAIKKGKLVRQPCEVCGDPESEAHHDDYSKPLEVRWFCGEHHRLHDGRQLD